MNDVYGWLKYNKTKFVVIFTCFFAKQNTKLIYFFMYLKYNTDTYYLRDITISGDVFKVLISEQSKNVLVLQ